MGAIYTGINGIAKKIKNIYLGIDNIAKKIKKIFIGINGTAKLVFSERQSQKVLFKLKDNPTTLSSARGRLAAVSVGNYGLFGGGDTANGYSSNYTNIVDAYNTSLTKSNPTTLSNGRIGMATITVGNYGLFGGGGSSSIIDAYDTSLTRSNSATLSVARNNLAATKAGNYGLFGGGGNGGGPYSDVVDAYDTDLTRTLPNTLAQGRYNLTAVSVGNYGLFNTGYGGSTYTYLDVYDNFLTKSSSSNYIDQLGLACITVGNYGLCGGGYSGGSVTNYYNYIYSYDTSLTKTNFSYLSSNKAFLAAVSIKNKQGLFGGGYNKTSGTSGQTYYYKTVDAYDDSLTKSIPNDLSSARDYLAAVSVGNYGLFGGGTTDASNNRSNVVDAYCYTEAHQEGSTLRKKGITYLSSNKASAAGGPVGDYGLLAGGSNSSNNFSNVEAFNTTLTKTSLTALSTQGSTAFSNSIKKDYILFGVGLSSTIDAYDSSLVKTNITALSQSRYSIATTSVGDYGLFGGGYYYRSNQQSTTYTYYNIIDVYDTSLTRSNPITLSIARSGMGSTSVGNYGLFGGGISQTSDGSSTTYYNIVEAQNTSLTGLILTELSIKRLNLAGISVGNYGLFGGGYYSSYNYSTGTTKTTYSNMVEAYDIYLTKSNPTTLSSAKIPCSVNFEDRNQGIFGGGSILTASGASSNTDAVEAYDTSLTKSYPTALSIARSGMGSTSVGNYGLFGGGVNTTTNSNGTVNYNYTNNVDIYEAVPIQIPD